MYLIYSLLYLMYNSQLCAGNSVWFHFLIWRRSVTMKAGWANCVSSERRASPSTLTNYGDELRIRLGLIQAWVYRGWPKFWWIGRWWKAPLMLFSQDWMTREHLHPRFSEKLHSFILCQNTLREVALQHSVHPRFMVGHIWGPEGWAPRRFRVALGRFLQWN